MKSVNFAKALLVTAVFAAATGTAVARDEPMYMPERVTVQAKPGLNQASLHDALVRAGAKRNWIVQGDTPGELLLKHSRNGKHEATVKISYDATSYQISYSGSYNLNADPDKQRIHPTYNFWLRNLSADIASEVSLIGLGK